MEDAGPDARGKARFDAADHDAMADVSTAVDADATADGASHDATTHDAAADAQDAACRSSRCGAMQLATGLPALLVLHSGSVYFAEPVEGGAFFGAIRKVSTDGGAVITVSADVHGFQTFAVGDEGVYVSGATFSADAGYSPGLFVAPADGGPPVRLHTGWVSGDANANVLVLANARLYWGSAFDVASGIRWLLLDGPARDGGVLAGVLGRSAYAPTRAAVDSTHVYFQTVRPATALVRVSRAGGDIEPLPVAPPAVNCLDLSVSGEHLYCADAVGSRIVAIPLRTGLPPVAPLVTGEVRHLATDDRFVYWVDTTDGAVRRASLDGSSVTTVLEAGPRVQLGDLAVDATAIYFTRLEWGDSGSASGAVMKVIK